MGSIPGGIDGIEVVFDDGSLGGPTRGLCWRAR